MVSSQFTDVISNSLITTYDGSLQKMCIYRPMNRYLTFLLPNISIGIGPKKMHIGQVQVTTAGFGIRVAERGLYYLYSGDILYPLADKNAQ